MRSCPDIKEIAIGIVIVVLSTLALGYFVREVVAWAITQHVLSQY